MGLGLQAAEGLSALQASIRQRIADQIAAQERERKFGLDTRHLDLQERQIDEQAALRKTMQADSAAKDAATEADRRVQRGVLLSDTIPAGTELPPSSPVVGYLRDAGAALTHADPNLASTSYTGAATLPSPATPMRGVLRVQNVEAKPERLIKGASAKQQNTTADNARADASAIAREEESNWRLSIAQQLADMRAGGAQPDQNKLENQYRTILMRPMSSRSGGLGLEDLKVQQTNHLTGLLDQYEGKSMPSNIAKELALGLARLTSPNGQVGVELMREIDQRTAQGSIGNLVSYVTGDPTLMNATPEKVRQVFRDSIERQGEIAAQNREGAMSYIRGLAPTDLEESRRLRLESGALVPLRKRANTPAAPGAKPTAADLIKKYGG